MSKGHQNIARVTYEEIGRTSDALVANRAKELLQRGTSMPHPCSRSA